MNRRHLFNLLVGVALAPRELIEFPARKIFLPPRGGWGAQTELLYLMRQYIERYDLPDSILVSPGVFRVIRSYDISMDSVF